MGPAPVQEEQRHERPDRGGPDAGQAEHQTRLPDPSDDAPEG